MRPIPDCFPALPCPAAIARCFVFALRCLHLPTATPRSSRWSARMATSTPAPTPAAPSSTPSSSSAGASSPHNASVRTTKRRPPLASRLYRSITHPASATSMWRMFHFACCLRTGRALNTSCGRSKVCADLSVCRSVCACSVRRAEHVLRGRRWRRAYHACKFVLLTNNTRMGVLLAFVSSTTRAQHRAY